MTENLSFSCLADNLSAAIRGWETEGGEWSDAAFDALARSAFQLQYDGIEPYRRYCDRRGVTPAAVSGWTDIPPAPVATFRHVPLIVGGEASAKLEFLTSGTTGGSANRGRHLVRDPGLYRTSMEATFLRLVLAQGRPAATAGDGAKWPDMFASLMAPFPESDASSLAWMIDGLMDRFGGPESRHFASASGVDWEAAGDFMADAAAERRAVCILTTTLALDAWIEQLGEDQPWQLSAGSIVMDTGGAKGREGRSRVEVCRRAAERLGIDPSAIVNEFGMTELLSQLYAVRDAPGLQGQPYLQGPPWLRARALDPNDLSTLPDGEPGLLCYFDLANLGSVCAVLTEDVGRVSGRAVHWLSRSRGASPRGCSLATAELLAAQEGSTGG